MRKYVLFPIIAAAILWSAWHTNTVAPTKESASATQASVLNEPTSASSASSSFTSSATSSASVQPVNEFYAPTFMFHYVRNEDPKAPSYPLTIAPRTLESYLQYFAEHSVTPITFRDVANYRDGLAPLPAKPVILTFDDSHIDHYTEAFRLLEQYNMKGVFYVYTNSIDAPGSMTAEQIKQIALVK